MEEHSRYVASIDDSPKPPPSRITLTFPVLNNFSRRIIFCGAGGSKQPILKAVLGNLTEAAGDSIETVDGAKAYTIDMMDPAPYPCGMVRTKNGGNTLLWVADADAVAGL